MRVFAEIPLHVCSIRCFQNARHTRSCHRTLFNRAGSEFVEGLLGAYARQRLSFGCSGKAPRGQTPWGEAKAANRTREIRPSGMKTGASGNVAMGAGLRSVGESRGDTTGPYSARARALSRPTPPSAAAWRLVVCGAARPFFYLRRPGRSFVCGGPGRVRVCGRAGASSSLRRTRRAMRTDGRPGVYRSVTGALPAVTEAFTGASEAWSRRAESRERVGSP
jgi:hypothetical protein